MDSNCSCEETEKTEDVEISSLGQKRKNNGEHPKCEVKRIKRDLQACTELKEMDGMDNEICRFTNTNTLEGNKLVNLDIKKKTGNLLGNNVTFNLYDKSGGNNFNQVKYIELKKDSINNKTLNIISKDKSFGNSVRFNGTLNKSNSSMKEDLKYKNCEPKFVNNISQESLERLDKTYENQKSTNDFTNKVSIFSRKDLTCSNASREEKQTIKTCRQDENMNNEPIKKFTLNLNLLEQQDSKDNQHLNGLCASNNLVPTRYHMKYEYRQMNEEKLNDILQENCTIKNTSASTVELENESHIENIDETIKLINCDIENSSPSVNEIDKMNTTSDKNVKIYINCVNENIGEMNFSKNILENDCKKEVLCESSQSLNTKETFNVWSNVDEIKHENFTQQEENNSLTSTDEYLNKSISNACKGDEIFTYKGDRIDEEDFHKLDQHIWEEQTTSYDYKMNLRDKCMICTCIFQTSEEWLKHMQSKKHINMFLKFKKSLGINSWKCENRDEVNPIDEFSDKTLNLGNKAAVINPVSYVPVDLSNRRIILFDQFNNGRNLLHRNNGDNSKKNPLSNQNCENTKLSDINFEEDNTNFCTENDYSLPLIFVPYEVNVCSTPNSEPNIVRMFLPYVDTQTSDQLNETQAYRNCSKWTCNPIQDKLIIKFNDDSSAFNQEMKTDKILPCMGKEMDAHQINANLSNQNHYIHTTSHASYCSLTEEELKEAFLRKLGLLSVKRIDDMLLNSSIYDSSLKDDIYYSTDLDNGSQYYCRSDDLITEGVDLNYKATKRKRIKRSKYLLRNVKSKEKVNSDNWPKIISKNKKISHKKTQYSNNILFLKGGKKSHSSSNQGHYVKISENILKFKGSSNIIKSSISKKNYKAAKPVFNETRKSKSLTLNKKSKQRLKSNFGGQISTKVTKKTQASQAMAEKSSKNSSIITRPRMQNLCSELRGNFNGDNSHSKSITPNKLKESKHDSSDIPIVFNSSHELDYIKAESKSSFLQNVASYEQEIEKNLVDEINYCNSNNWERTDETSLECLKKDFESENDSCDMDEAYSKLLHGFV